MLWLVVWPQNDRHFQIKKILIFWKMSVCLSSSDRILSKLLETYSRASWIWGGRERLGETGSAKETLEYETKVFPSWSHLSGVCFSGLPWSAMHGLPSVCPRLWKPFYFLYSKSILHQLAYDFLSFYCMGLAEQCYFLLSDTTLILLKKKKLLRSCRRY